MLQRLLASHSESAVRQRWREALEVVNDHWDRVLGGEQPLRAQSPWQLRWGRRFSRLRRSS